MNQMFRRPGQDTVRHADILSQGHRDWNEEISRAISARTAWRTTAWLVLGVLGISVAGNVWLAGQSRVQVVHVVHDKIGDVIAVSHSSDVPGGPTQLMIQAALRGWVANVRDVYVDIAAQKAAILSAYALVRPGSQANADLTAYYRGDDPFGRAAIQTAHAHDIVPVPPTSATIGPNGMQTWSLTWIERTESRDGQTVTETPHAGNITFTLSTAGFRDNDPDGIDIIATSGISVSGN